MTDRYDIGFIGFGEAASAFVEGWRAEALPLRICAYDRLFDDAKQSRCERVQNRCRNFGVEALASAAAVRDGSLLLISAVTADQVHAAATSVAPLKAGQLYLDINSAAPQRKCATAELLGAGYLDCAVLSPVQPKRQRSPMLAGGPRADSSRPTLAKLFPDCRITGVEPGVASQIKMIRSVFVKGLEAVAAECALAIRAAGLDADILPSLDVALRFDQAEALMSYNLERVASHGQRRSAEMREVCETLKALGVPDTMSAATAETQARIGALGLPTDGKLASATLETLANAILERFDEHRDEPAGKPARVPDQ